jgi:CO/xanthine dehydrogenase FAD-binding subunit
MNKDLGVVPEPAAEEEKFTHFDAAGVEETKQHKLYEKPVGERTLADEDRMSLDQQTAVKEAERCLHCACYAVNPSDLTPVLVMLGAEIQTTERVIPAKELFTQKLTVQHILHKGELVTEIRIPKCSGEMHYDKRRVRDAIDFAIVSLANRIEVKDGVVKDARLVFGGVAPVPYELPGVEAYLKGKKIDREVAREASRIALEDATPMGHNEYKVFMARDVVYQAVCRAGGIQEEEIPVL